MPLPVAAARRAGPGSRLGAGLGTAVRNAWALTLGSGVSAPQRTPTETVYAGPHRTLLRYRDETGGAPSGNPVMLVPPLAVPATCYDLHPGQSLARHLLDRGRAAYVVDYGEISFADRRMGFEDWVDDIVPTAIRRVSAEHGGAPVDVIGWSLGGTLLYLTAAGDPTLPIGSIVALGTPVDYSRIPATALARAAGRLTGGHVLTVPGRVLGGVPAPLVQLTYRLTAPGRELTRGLFVLRNLGDAETLGRMEAIDRFQRAMPAYPGRLYLQMYQRLILRLELAKGRVRLGGGRLIELSRLEPRVLVVGSPTDAIAPAPAVRAALEVLTGAASVEYAEVEASHLGLVAGGDAATTTWPLIDRFLGLDARASRSA